MVLVYWTTHTNPTHPHGGVGGGVVRGWSPPCCRLVGGGADDGVAGGGEGRGGGQTTTVKHTYNKFRNIYIKIKLYIHMIAGSLLTDGIYILS